METIFILLFFILGTIMGSFYHVVGTRLSESGSIIKPRRSYCPFCGHILKWYELIPILSYIIQKGKCRKCHCHIPFLYLLIELASGLLYGVSYYSFGFSYDLIISLSIVSLFMIVLVSDLNYMIIPDEVIVVISIIIALTNFFLYGLEGGLLKIASGALMFFIMYGLMLVGNFIFQKESLGGGDIKLMFVVGLIVHPFLGLFVIFIASFIALPVSLALYFKEKERIIPFGPFLVAALAFVYFMKIDIASLQEMLKALVVVYPF